MKERWTVGLFNEICACLVWWRDTTIVAEDKWPRDCAEYLLNKLIRYGQVYRDDDEVRVSLWPNDSSEVQRIYGMPVPNRAGSCWQHRTWQLRTGTQRWMRRATRAHLRYRDCRDDL